jgi:hypothetical protein
MVADNRASLALFRRRGFRQSAVRTSRLKAWLLGETTVVRLEKRREVTVAPRPPAVAPAAGGLLAGARSLPRRRRQEPVG